jgi:hypothetical protein
MFQLSFAVLFSLSHLDISAFKPALILHFSDLILQQAWLYSPVQRVCRKLLHTTEMSASLCSAHSSLTYVSEHLLFHVYLNTQVLKGDSFIL